MKIEINCSKHRTYLNLTHLLAEEELARNFVRFCEMQRTSSVHQETIRGRENNQIDIKH